MEKEFSSKALVGTYSGILLEEGGFRDIHELVDLFYPGIMTLGLCMVMQDLKPVLLAQFPQLAEFEKDAIATEGFRRTAERAVEVFGERVTVSSTSIDIDPLKLELEQCRAMGKEVVTVVV